MTLQSVPAAIGEASVWLRDLGSRHGMDEQSLFHLDLCASELMANAASYAYPGVIGEINLELALDQGSAKLTVVDTGSPFNPLTHEMPSPPNSLQDAPDGGLGLHLVRKFADSMHYERGAGRNVVTLRIRSDAACGTRSAAAHEVGPAAPADPGREGARGTRTGWADPPVVATIGDMGLFRDVPSDDLERILAQCELRTCGAGEVLLREGEHHHCVLVPIDGTLEVHLDAPNSPFPIELGAGECVGELSIVDRKPISAWVVAATAGRLLVIPEQVFLGPLLAVPAIARNLLAMQSERMRRGNAQVVARIRSAMELEALQRELDLARQIQSNMLPAAPLFPAGGGIDGCGFMRPARQVGGDFYDAFPLGDGLHFVAIGDVCNKGMPAALFMVRTLTLMRAEAMYPEADMERRLARLLGRCNDLLNHANEAQQFVTLFCAVVDTVHERLHFVNAGHNRPLLLRPGVASAFLAGPRNPIVGMVPGLSYVAGGCAFRPGSLLLMYTDGVTEAEAEGGAMFGDAELLRLLADGAAAGADACVERVITAVDAFAGAHPQSDDITLLAVRRL